MGQRVEYRPTHASGVEGIDPARSWKAVAPRGSLTGFRSATAFPV
jgi:hypothetical protein